MNGGCCVGDLYGDDSSLCSRQVTNIVAGAIAGDSGQPLAMLLPVCCEHAPILEAWLAKDSRLGRAVSYPVGALTGA
jgi:hypothetical protein